jgi:hypothetical protein
MVEIARRGRLFCSAAFAALASGLLAEGASAKGSSPCLRAHTAIHPCWLGLLVVRQ